MPGSSQKVLDDVLGSPTRSSPCPWTYCYYELSPTDRDGACSRLPLLEHFPPFFCCTFSVTNWSKRSQGRNPENSTATNTDTNGRHIKRPPTLRGTLGVRRVHTCQNVIRNELAAVLQGARLALLHEPLKVCHVSRRGRQHFGVHLRQLIGESVEEPPGDPPADGKGVQRLRPGGELVGVLAMQSLGDWERANTQQGESVGLRARGGRRGSQQRACAMVGW